MLFIHHHNQTANLGGHSDRAKNLRNLQKNIHETHNVNALYNTKLLRRIF